MRYLLLLFAFISCSPLKSQLGVRIVHPEPTRYEITAADFDELAERVMAELEDLYPLNYTREMMLAALDGTRVSVRYDVIVCPPHPQGCEGLTHVWLKTMQLYVHSECAADSALIHELLHLFRFQIELDGDSNHEDPVFFAVPDSIEIRLEQETRKLCDD